MSDIINSSSILKTLDPLHVQDILNQNHSSHFFRTKEYDLLIMRFFKLDEEEGLKGVSIPYLIQNKNIYKYTREDDHFIHIASHARLIDSIHGDLKHSEWLVQKYVEEIDSLEDALYTRKIPAIFLDTWFDLKKDLTRVDRILDRSNDVLHEYKVAYENSGELPGDTTANLFEHIGRYQRMASLNALRLDALYNYYNSLKNDKINSNIYLLTILSGIFLPLNLVVGFFGMNTENLFFNGDAQGTLKVVVLLALLFVTLVIIFPLLRILERYIVQKLLGKFNTYSKIEGAIKKITKPDELR